MVVWEIVVQVVGDARASVKYQAAGKKSPELNTSNEREAILRTKMRSPALVD